MHSAIYYSNQHNVAKLLALITEGDSGLLLPNVNAPKIAVFSPQTLQQFLQKEHQHDQTVLTQSGRRLATLSEGEQKQALLAYLLAQQPDYIIVQNVFDNLDQQKQQVLSQTLEGLGIPVVQLLNRRRDVLPFILQRFGFDGKAIEQALWPAVTPAIEYQGTPPTPITAEAKLPDTLIELQNVSVAFGEKPVLDKVSWCIKKGELWQLVGANGSGKSTLLQLVTGDNPKAYGQNIYLFGRKKGSGESVWDIKKHIGYFTKAMVQNFNSHDTVESMVLSGFFDSVGLYQTASKAQRETVAKWLSLVGFESLAKEKFATLNAGSQRLLLVLRAMVKQPPLLLLDEPTVGLDDSEAAKLVALVNCLAKTQKTAIVFVSHQNEQGLKADAILQLVAGDNGSKALLM